MKWTFTLLLAMAGLVTNAQQKIANRIILIGNAGESPEHRDKVLNSIKQAVSFDSNTTVLFMGDNFYKPDGQVDASAQLNLVRNTQAKAIFLPGKYEWNNGKHYGYDSVKKWASYINGLNDEKIKFLPEEGCPGPEKVELSKDVVLMIMDSQWWLHGNEKPDIESACKYKTKEEILLEIEDIVKDVPDKLLIFATHHPFKSTGVHSGYFGLKQHIFPLTDIRGMKHFYLPLPVIGSLYPITENVFSSREDFKHPYYQRMVYKVEDILKEHPNVLHVAGHEHQLELMHFEDSYYMVSGAAAPTERVSKNRRVQYAESTPGFAVIDIYDDKKVFTSFYEVEDETARKTYEKSIIDFSYRPPIAEDTATVDYTGRDSVVAAVNKWYSQANGLKRWFTGDNYRDVWAADVKMKVFDITTQEGGMKVTGIGGGKQSKTLHLEDADGTGWALRSLNKDLQKAVPAPLRNTFAQALAQDMISTANPYGFLAMPKLYDALGLIHTSPQVVYVPNDTAIGFYRSAFANTVCMLEIKEPTLYGENARGSMSAFNKMIDDNDHLADQHTYLKIRMLDFLIGDFDRHYDQWKWGKLDTGKGALYYPIAKDRDQAFFYSDGAIMALVAWRHMIQMRGFKHKMRKPEWLAFAARDMDRFFLNEVDEKEWKNTLDTFTTVLTDDVIEDAVKAYPPEIYALRGEETISKLKTRRELMKGNGMEYYKFLAKRVNVMGSNKAEIFKVTGDAEGLKVNVYDRTKEGEPGFLKYSRAFSDEHTKEIRLYGLNGDDRFEVDESVPSGIKFRIIGGKGEDTFNINGRARNLIYDNKKEENTIISRSRTTNMISARSDVNEYEFREQIYNSVIIPKLTLGINQEDGFLAGLGASKTWQGFRSSPYSVYQSVSTLFAFQQPSYQIKYTGIYNDIVRHFDLVTQGQIVNPTLNNFFGLGNETVSYIETRGIAYHRARYSFASADVLARKRYWHDIVHIEAGPTFYNYWNHLEDNTGKVLSRPSEVGLDSSVVYSQKLYGGGKLNLAMIYLNNPFFPTQGVNWVTSFSSMTGLNEATTPITKLESYFDMYSDLTDDAKLVVGLHLGGGHIFSDKYEYFQAFTLGANNYLRGYRKNRFSGSSMAYGSTELRYKMAKLNGFIFSGDFGVIGFGDVGRVWHKGETSKVWHTSYGGGLYFSPFNLLMISALAGISEEEMLINISVGTKFNITF